MTRRSRRFGCAAIIAICFAYAGIVQAVSWNQHSHYDLIQALYTGDAKIDDYEANTGDKVLFKDHWYSARAPGMALSALPLYGFLDLIDARGWEQKHQTWRHDETIVWMLGLWGNVLPGVLMLLLVWRIAERLKPGYGILAATTLGLGTLILPLSTLLFSHVFAAFLGFAAFALLFRERAGPARLWMVGLAGVIAGYGVGSEYPVFFVAAILGFYLLAHPQTRALKARVVRAFTYIVGGIVGIIPLLAYNQLAFGDWTHLAYADVPRQQVGFFGITLPDPVVLATLLFDSRGLFTLAPVLLLATAGIWLLYRQGKRAEALVIGTICATYCIYNSGYYLPFGGGFMGPRFLTTMLPFLALPLALAFRRWPGVTVGLAVISITTMATATLTHPLTGYETETVIWMQLLGAQDFQSTVATLFGHGHAWRAATVFVVPLALGVAFTVLSAQRLRFSNRAVLTGVVAVVLWGLFATVVPTISGLDHEGLLSISRAGDTNALTKPWGPYPLRDLAIFAAAIGVLTLVIGRILSPAKRMVQPVIVTSKSPAKAAIAR